jgi:predicted transport protein
MPQEIWQCPKCAREFSRKNQRHACGTGNSADVLRDRPQAVIEVYRAIESFINNLGKVETVARDRYVLFRSRRIFVDLSVMQNAVRVAIHLSRRIDNPAFIKIVADGKQVTHVAKITNLAELKHIEPLIIEAYQFSLA